LLNQIFKLIKKIQTRNRIIFDEPNKIQDELASKRYIYELKEKKREVETLERERGEGLRNQR
jgi:cobalamin biosynthesis Co2+ chelatase CbiK